MKKLSYSEGDVFLVPLGNGGHARGVIARSAPEGKILFGYFFDSSLNTDADIDRNGLRADTALISMRFADLGLIKGFWPITGSVENWDRTKWPMGHAVRRDALGKIKPVLVRYSDDDPSKIINEEIMEKDNDLPTDGLAGYRYVQALLSELLN